MLDEPMLIPEDRKALWRSVRGNSQFLNLLAIVVVPAAFAFWLDKVDADRVGSTAYGAAIFVLVAIQVVLFYLASQGSNALPLVQAAKEDLEATNDHLSEALVEASRESTWLAAARELGQIWSIGQSIFAGSFDLSDRHVVAALAESVVLPMVHAGHILFDFEFDEVWSAAVYVCEDDGRTLEPLWIGRAATHPASGIGRTWEKGEGHIGQAFLSQKTVFTANAGDDELHAVITPTAPNLRDYDRDAYRSFVSVPVTIGTGEASRRLGVLALTSDRVGRFDEDNKEVVEHAAIVLSQLLDLSRLATLKADT